MNPPTEQVARDNRLREKIAPSKPSPEPENGKAATDQDKQLGRSSWDPAQHPNYSLNYQRDSLAEADYDGANIAGRIDAMTRTDLGELALNDQVPKDNGYTMGLKMPEEVLEKIEQLKRFEQTRAVVAMRYQQATVANMPSEVLIVI